MDQGSKIFVAGHRGMVGSAIVRALRAKGFSNLVLKTRSEVNLLDDQAVRDFYASEKPEFVFVAAARVGGIVANNTYPAEFLLENLRIQNNLIEGAAKNGVEKLLFLGSSCIYPKFAPQPIMEEALLTSALEPTNEAYALAKIAGVKMCEYYKREHGKRFISAMPTNLYGQNDNYDLQNSHVLPALIRKFHVAKETGAESVELWGTGTPRREFLHADDLADACLFLMDHYEKPTHINVGTGEDSTIRELAEMVRDIVGFQGRIDWNTDKPDGTPRKLLDVSKLHELGWKHRIPLEEGIRGVYQNVDKSTWLDGLVASKA